ncbi:MAG TPA: 2-succinyl-5-enolpyruvyl-6-hydroxy-3-cyclohexene-1-carboxylic-acid synthase [Kofleriaceae bacterium]|nr:2-succinyl-5-enolpyruvyl-6-hydroxy-3-cyclohexene-1-carboxylic-acid synthase [Kofleriaceae bacterium]
MSLQTAWADLIVATLASCGVEMIVISPGSRSTPIAAAIARSSLSHEVIIDERAAGFFALGRARATGKPVALVCTSGTAPAHYYPSVIEASEAGVPLVVVSADRPSELQGCGAPQTIDQQRLYGGFVRAFVDLGAPEVGAPAMRAMRRKIAQAVAASRGPKPGPVQINVPLRKPLEPTAPPDDVAAIAKRLIDEPLFAPAPALRASDDAIAHVASLIENAERPLIVCGPSRSDARDALHDLAIACGAVVCAEATSNLRFGPRPASVAACDAFDLVLASRRAPAPDLIVQIGGEPSAQAWAPFAAATPRVVIADARYPDADSAARAVITGELADTLARLATAIPKRDRDRSWQDAWRALDARAWIEIDRAITQEPAAIRAAITAAPPHAQLAIGNSLPVRVIDQAVRGGGAARTILSQRGASGIDGLIASAAGAASGGRPTLLVVGDVSFAHDSASLQIARASKAPLAIVVIDNGGGRIFDQLPLRPDQLPDGAFARMWTTPPSLDPIAIAIAYGARAVHATDPAAIASATAAALERPGATVIHAPVAPDSALTFRRAVVAALSGE